MLEVSAIET